MTDKNKRWIQRNALEFLIDNFPDITEGGKKVECIICHKYDYHKNMDNDRLGLTYWCVHHNNEMSREEYIKLRYD